MEDTNVTHKQSSQSCARRFGARASLAMYTRRSCRRSRRTPARAVPAESVLRQQINEWTVGLAGGLLEGAPIRLATEIARVVNDGANLHVLPIVTRGPTENVNDLLYLKGVDMAIIASDSLEEYKSQVPDIQQRLTYILNLFPSEVHIFVAARDQVAARSRRQEGQLQHARARRRPLPAR